MARAAFAFAIVGVCASARAADLHVIYPSALSPALDELLPRYERASGNRIAHDHGGLGAIAERVGKGEAFDIVISSRGQIDSMVAKNLVASASGANIAMGGIGVGVRKGVAKPALATVDAFKASLLSAKSLAYVDPATGSAVGAYLTQLFARLDLTNALLSKTILAKSAAALFDAVNTEKADLALAQMSEIAAADALQLAGPLPAEIQNRTMFAAGVAVNSTHAADARALIAFLAAPDAAKVFAAKGLAP